MRYKVTVLVAGTLLLFGCAMGPNYRRPTVEMPPTFRGADATAGETSLADTKWADLFQDPVLTELLSTALKRNYDFRIAAERVLQARAQLGITRSDLLPTLEVNGRFSANRNSQIGANQLVPRGTNLDVSYTQVGFSLGWELDVWGRLRRLKESARAQYLATEEAQRGVTTTLLADITTGYFRLRELDLELEIARKTRDVAEDSLRLTSLRRDRGVATGLDVHQAQQLLHTATAQIAASERAITQVENSLSVLLGQPPGDVPRGRRLDRLTAPAQVPAGLPSTLLTRRPDIRQAEQMLIAANAQIGAARALYFPQISLTGFLGGQSRALTDLFTGPGRQWNFNPVAGLPVFNAGRVRSTVKLTEAVKREALVSYEKTIQTAFGEVSDALVSFHKTTEQLEQQRLLVAALRESNRLSLLRYQGGLDSYLQVLDAQRNLFQGELALAQLRREQLLAVVQLYRALGGGWQ
ncbi:MAG TPA: efflux transporter outer membrane subunit [Acidobacteriota bacterium]